MKFMPSIPKHFSMLILLVGIGAAFAQNYDFEINPKPYLNGEDATSECFETTCGNCATDYQIMEKKS